jgi:hypothetical protein
MVAQIIYIEQGLLGLGLGFLTLKTNGENKMSDNQLRFKTENYDVNRIAAGKIGEDGITFTMIEMADMGGKHGDFWRVKGIVNKGKGLVNGETEIVIDFSSGKLHSLISHNLDVMLNQVVKICGRGKSFSRNYDVYLIDDPKLYNQNIEIVKALVKASIPEDA